MSWERGKDDIEALWAMVSSSAFSLRGRLVSACWPRRKDT